jgi:hypothetical protein
MNNETDNLRRIGPTTAVFGYSFKGKEKYQVGDIIHDNSVIAKTDKGDRVCVSRSRSLCSVCLASGWAAKKNCQNPIKDN